MPFIMSYQSVLLPPLSFKVALFPYTVTNYFFHINVETDLTFFLLILHN